MRKFTISLCLGIGVSFLFLSGCQSLPSPNASFFLKYFGENGYQTAADFVVDPNDGSFYMLGTTSEVVNDSTATLFLVKCDRNGNFERKAYVTLPALSVSEGAEARDIEFLSNGNIIVLGNSYTTLTDRDILIAEFDKDLNQVGDAAIVRVKSQIDSTKTQDDRASSITEIKNKDGSTGFMVAGYSVNITPTTGSVHQRDALHLKLNSKFQQVKGWNLAESPGTVNVEQKIFQVGPDTFLSFGYSNENAPSADYNFWSFKIKSDGSGELYSHNGSPSDDERMGAVVLKESGGNKFYYAAGVATPRGSSSSYMFQSAYQVTNDSILSENFIQTPSLPFQLKTPKTSVASIAVCADGGFLILTNEKTGGNDNWLLLKRNDDGSTDWKTPISFGGVGEDVVGVVRELPDGHIAVCGTMSLNGEWKMALMKLNKNGELAE